MSQPDKNPDLSGAIKQLEALLDAQSDGDEQDGRDPDNRLPILDEVVAADATDDLDHAFAWSSEHGASARPDPEQVRAILARISEQMDTKLENVVGMLKQNMVEEFRNELAAALNLDPQQLKINTGGQDNQQS